MFLKIFGLSIKTIIKDPINISLAIIPTLISLIFYIGLIVLIASNFDQLTLFLATYIPNQDVAGWVGKILGFIFILFIFLLINWTHIILVGLISTPFNSLLSARIEAQFFQRPIEQDRSRTLKEVFKNFFKTIRGEFLKFLFIFVLSILAILLNIIPFFYPIALVLLSLLMSVQFLDFTWSRNNLKFSDCLKDIFNSFFSYLFSGFLFLIFMTIPFINSIIPAVATSYMTILWLMKNKKIQI